MLKTKDLSPLLFAKAFTMYLGRYALRVIESQDHKKTTALGGF